MSDTLAARRRFTVFSASGLANRIKVLVSGRVLAEACGAELRVLWPLTPFCNCPYERLFVADAGVVTVAGGAVRGLPLFGGWGAIPPDLMAICGDAVVGHVSWLVRPDLYPRHAALWPALGPALGALVATSEIAERVEGFAARHFRPHMLGVHLRRGDFLGARGDVSANTEEALRAVEQQLVAEPRAGIFLATDDGAAAGRDGPVSEGVRERMRRRFGERVVFTTPRSLDRRAPEAIEDALVDLLLLRRTRAVIGTAASSFSELGAFGRDVPLTMTAGTAERVLRLERFVRRVGLHPLIVGAARRSLGREPESFFVAWMAVRHAPVVDPIMNVVRRIVRWRP